MKRRHWLWIFICAMLFLTMGMSDSQAFTKDENEPPIVGNYLEMSESGIPTTTVTVDEVGMWIIYTHDAEGAPFRAVSSATQNLITGDIWIDGVYGLVKWSATEGMMTVSSADFGYPDEVITDVDSDHTGNMWFGIYTGSSRDERPDGELFMLALDGTIYDYSDKVGAAKYTLSVI